MDKGHPEHAQAVRLPNQFGAVISRAKADPRAAFALKEEAQRVRRSTRQRLTVEP